MASILSNLTWTVVDATSAQAMGMLFNYIESKLGNGGRDTETKFYYQFEAGGALWNILTRGAVNAAASYLSDAVVDQYKKFLSVKAQSDINERASTLARLNIIKEHKAKDTNRYGVFKVNKNKKVSATEVPSDGLDVMSNSVLALDYCGNLCTDALMLGIPSKSPVTVVQKVINPNTVGDPWLRDKTIQSDMLVWYDTVAMVTVDSDKNLILTPVQGRDYTRKELISNGDKHISVTGRICSNLPEVYPEEEVKKFLQIMDYKGIVEVNNQILDQFGISKIIIKNYNLSNKEGSKSDQMYTFTAVGIQPDTEIEIKEDTITIINQELVNTNGSDDDGWGKLLKDKLESMKGYSSDLLSQGLALATGILDDELSNM